MGGIVYEFKNTETPSLDDSYNNDWYDDLVRDETGMELTEDQDQNDVFFEPCFRITDTVDDVGEEYAEASDDAPEKDSVNAQRYMDECTQNGMVYQNVDMRPVVYQVMQWLRSTTHQELPEHGRKHIRALSFLQTALHTNKNMRTHLIECGIVPFVVRQIAFNNHKAMLMRTRGLDAHVHS